MIYPKALRVDFYLNRMGYYLMKNNIKIFSILLLVATFSSCAPKVEIKAPSEPIVINLNIDIEHKIKVKIDKELEDAMNDESIF